MTPFTRAVLILWIIVLIAAPSLGQQTPSITISEQTQACIDCHETSTPGIVADWRLSRHAQTTPQAALAKPALERRISASSLTEDLKKNVIGCFECHSQQPGKHADQFEHFGYTIHVVVSPGDCKTCHPTEVEQYSGSKKAHANGNLVKNPVYALLMQTITRSMSVDKGKLAPGKSSANANNETCLACHGTTITVHGSRSIETDAGAIDIPRIANWPNMGVGRVNTDGSLGSCTSCHPRHGFSIEVARKPETCGQCHLEPDVPGYNVYKESKHGNILDAKKEKWNWDAVPWTLGKDFTAPTCATCHNGLVVAPGGTVIAERSHDFGARLWVRLFGLVYSHPQPLSGKTYEIVNADKLPLPTTFGGKPATGFLISPEEQAKRKTAMKGICRNCHGSDWADQHFAKLDTTLVETDAMTLAATQLLSRAWETKVASNANPFDEPLEQDWVRQWLFYANSVRSASAMAGPDYAAFKHGWWDLTHNLQKMQKELDLKQTK